MAMAMLAPNSVRPITRWVSSESLLKRPRSPAMIPNRLNARTAMMRWMLFTRAPLKTAIRYIPAALRSPFNFQYNAAGAASSLIEQAPAQFLERDHDVIAKRGALRTRAIPAFDPRQRRTLDLQLEIPVQRRSGGNIGQGQRVSEQK